jgi:hypothetical protein
MTRFLALTVAAIVFAVASPLFAAGFNDVPRTHWAYDAIQKAVDAGILQGYDNKFDGKQLLNRYQMAVVVSKMLDKMGKGAPAGMPSGDWSRQLQNLEALTIEFADELAKLNVQVSTLEDSFAELKAKVDNMKGGHAASQTMGGGLGFTAFASFGLVSTDDMDDGDDGVMSRYGDDQADSMFFTLPQVSIGVDKQVNEGVYFHAQFDYASEINDEAGYVGVNECYFFVDELFGDIGGKVGAFALPLSMEHNGPFRSLNYTITPSALNTMNEMWRGYGLEFQKTKDVNPEDIFFKVGICSGLSSDLWDFSGGPGTFPGHFLTDAPVWINNQGETDDTFGYYFMVGKKPQRKGQLGWNFAWFDNGGDTENTDHDTSDEVDYWQIGLEWANDDLTVLLQYADGSLGDDQDPDEDLDTNAYFLLVNFKIDEKQSVTLRYDTIEFSGEGDESFDVTTITLAYNRKVTDNSMLQLEWLSPDSDVSEISGYEDMSDDLIQLRYKVHF